MELKIIIAGDSFSDLEFRKTDTTYLCKLKNCYPDIIFLGKEATSNYDILQSILPYKDQKALFIVNLSSIIRLPENTPQNWMEHAEYAEFINHLLTKEILRSFNGFFWTTFSGYENYSQIEKLFYTDFYNKHKKLNKYLSIQTNLY